MIAYRDALSLRSLSVAEAEKLCALEEAVDANIREHFVGGPFTFSITRDVAASLATVAALVRLYEEGGWRVTVWNGEEDVAFVLRFSSPDASAVAVENLRRDVAALRAPVVVEPPRAPPAQVPQVPILAERRDISDEVTVFVATVGDEANYLACREALDRQTTIFRVEVVDRVAPMSAAFQAMLDRCETPYYIQVDEDMHLYPDGVERLYRLIAERESPQNVMFCAPLWDVDTARAITGVKIYEHAAVRQYPYHDVFSCEIDQVARIRQGGYEVVVLPSTPRERCFGLHGATYTPRTMFKRWRRLVQKQRQFDQMRWIELVFRAHAERYRETGDDVHLAAVLGMVAGLVGDVPPNRELDFRDPDPDWDRVRERYFRGST